MRAITRHSTLMNGQLETRQHARTPTRAVDDVIHISTVTPALDAYAAEAVDGLFEPSIKLVMGPKPASLEHLTPIDIDGNVFPAKEKKDDRKGDQLSQDQRLAEERKHARVVGLHGGVVDLEVVSLGSVPASDGLGTVNGEVTECATIGDAGPALKPVRESTNSDVHEPKMLDQNERKPEGLESEQESNARSDEGLPKQSPDGVSYGSHEPGRAFKQARAESGANKHYVRPMFVVALIVTLIAAVVAPYCVSDEAPVEVVVTESQNQRHAPSTLVESREIAPQESSTDNTPQPTQVSQPQDKSFQDSPAPVLATTPATSAVHKLDDRVGGGEDKERTAGLAPLPRSITELGRNARSGPLPGVGLPTVLPIQTPPKLPAPVPMPINMERSIDIPVSQRQVAPVRAKTPVREDVNTTVPIEPDQRTVSKSNNALLIFDAHAYADSHGNSAPAERRSTPMANSITDTPYRAPEPQGGTVTHLTLVAIPDERSVLVTNPRTRLPIVVNVGELLPTGERLIAAFPKSASIRTDARTVQME
jgi:hypothetical protein